MIGALLHVHDELVLQDRIIASLVLNYLPNYHKRETMIIGEIRGTLDSLKGKMSKVTTDSIRDNVEKLSGLFDALVRSRDNIKSEFRIRMARERSRADVHVVDNKITDRSGIGNSGQEAKRRHTGKVDGSCQETGEGEATTHHGPTRHAYYYHTDTKIPI